MDGYGPRSSWTRRLNVMEVRAVVEEIEMEWPESAGSATVTRPMTSELGPDGLKASVGGRASPQHRSSHE